MLIKNIYIKLRSIAHTRRFARIDMDILQKE